MLTHEPLDALSIVIVFIDIDPEHSLPDPYIDTNQGLPCVHDTLRFDPRRFNDTAVSIDWHPHLIKELELRQLGQRAWQRFAFAILIEVLEPAALGLNLLCDTCQHLALLHPLQTCLHCKLRPSFVRPLGPLRLVTNTIVKLGFKSAMVFLLLEFDIVYWLLHPLLPLRE